MSRSATSLEESYQLCRRVARQAGSSFTPCFHTLPRAKRDSMYALYAFMRKTDDLADSTDPVEQRREALAQWRSNLLDSSNARATSEDVTILPAVADTLRRHAIPFEYLNTVIDGVEMDLSPRRFETSGELAEYCHRVSSAVGLASIRIWGVHGEGFERHARRCGLAFQMTNILRDLKEDAAQGRVYLPQEDLRAHGYSEDDLHRGTANVCFEQLMAFEIERTETFYREGEALLPHLAPDGRRTFGMMMETYYALLKKIRRDPTAVLQSRVRLNGLKKTRLAARWILTRPRRLRLR